MTQGTVKLHEAVSDWEGIRGNIKDNAIRSYGAL